jgi:tetratricopeptide (TPR) repeat protein
MVISYAAYPVSVLLFFKGPVLQLLTLFQIDPFTLRNIATAVILLVSIVVYFRFVFGYFMRNFERQADVYVFELFPTAMPLISTFDKIVLSSGQPADKPNWHHFSIKQRIDYLWRCEHHPEWIMRQNQKVSKSIVAFVAAFILLALAAFQLNQMVLYSGSRYISVTDLEAYLDQKENKTVEDGVRYWIIGNVYYERQNLDRAASAYEAAIVLDPKNSDALNNLAWLLATIDNPKLHNPQKALQYAQKAIALKKAPHIWDTLAECLYVNGRVAEAIEAENQALRMAPEDRQIYEKQLEKFKQALMRIQ